MIIRTLTINNFRNYVGTNIFDLSTTRSRNIILIGGQNGAGKTSMADAVRLCLYGHWVDGRILSESKYQEYLYDVCSDSARDKGFYVNISLVIDEENPPIDVNVTRKFVRRDQKFSEQLILKKGDSEVEMIDESYWSYYIEKLISPTVSRYFFFDGEKVRDTIASPDAQSYLMNAVSDVSGITELNNLQTDLEEVRKRILSKSTQKSELKRIDALHSEISRLEANLEKISLQISEELERAEALGRLKNELSQERGRLIGSSESRRDELKEQLALVTENYNESSAAVAEFCFNRLIYRLADRSIKATVSQARQENSGLINRYSVEALNELSRSGSLQDVLGKDERESQEIISRIVKALQDSGTESGDSYLDLTLSRIEQIESMRVSTEECDAFMEKVRDRDHFEQESKRLQKKLAKAEDVSVEEIDERLREFATEIEVANRAAERLREEAQTLSSEIDTKRALLKREERSMVLGDVDRASVDNIEKVSKVISQRKEITLLKSRETLSKRVNEMYGILKNNKDMVKEVRITEDFGLQLINFKDEAINTKYISEGEKSILMYSVMFGLHSLSNMRFPVIIDSPIGKMDSLHVHNLATKLYPTVADQVILLSHDREITRENYGLIEEYVSRRYLVTKYGDPKVKEGYFE